MKLCPLAVLLLATGCARQPRPVSCGPHCDEYRYCNYEDAPRFTTLHFRSQQEHGRQYNRPSAWFDEVLVVSLGDTTEYAGLAFKSSFEAPAWWTIIEETTESKTNPRIIIPSRSCVVHRIFF